MSTLPTLPPSTPLPPVATILITTPRGVFGSTHEWDCAGSLSIPDFFHLARCLQCSSVLPYPWWPLGWFLLWWLLRVTQRWTLAVASLPHTGFSSLTWTSRDKIVRYRGGSVFSLQDLDAVSHEGGSPSHLHRQHARVPLFLTSSLALVTASLSKVIVAGDRWSLGYLLPCY